MPLNSHAGITKSLARPNAPAILRAGALSQLPVGVGQSGLAGGIAAGGAEREIGLAAGGRRLRTLITPCDLDLVLSR